MKFEINLIFLIKLFFYMTRKWRQKLKYLEYENSFWGEEFFIIFKGLPIAKSCLRPKSALKGQLPQIWPCLGGWKIFASKRGREEMGSFIWNKSIEKIHS